MRLFLRHRHAGAAFHAADPGARPPPGHRVFCYGSGLAFSPDGSLLAVQDCDGVRVWTLDIDELLAIARTNVTRSLTSEECRLYLHVDPC